MPHWEADGASGYVSVPGSVGAPRATAGAQMKRALPVRSVTARPNFVYRTWVEADTRIERDSKHAAVSCATGRSDVGALHERAARRFRSHRMRGAPTDHARSGLTRGAPRARGFVGASAGVRAGRADTQRGSERRGQSAQLGRDGGDVARAVGTDAEGRGRRRPQGDVCAASSRGRRVLLCPGSRRGGDRVGAVATQADDVGGRGRVRDRAVNARHRLRLRVAARESCRVPVAG